MTSDIQMVTKYKMKEGNNWGAGVLILDKNNWALAGKRNDNGLWCTPGGGVEVGETCVQGIIREVHEETNLDILDPELIDIQPSFNDKVWLSFFFLAKEYSGEVRPQKSEMLELKWMTISELMKLELFQPRPEQKSGFRACADKMFNTEAGWKMNLSEYQNRVYQGGNQS